MLKDIFAQGASGDYPRSRRLEAWKTRHFKMLYFHPLHSKTGISKMVVVVDFGHCRLGLSTRVYTFMMSLNPFPGILFLEPWMLFHKREKMSAMFLTRPSQA